MTEPIDYPGDVPTCEKHGYELEPDGYCEGCWLESYEQSLTWDADDEADDRYERDIDLDRAA